MKLLNGIFMLLLALFATALGLFFIGSQEDYNRMITQQFWQTLGLRIVFANSVGLLAAGLWWGVNVTLLKGGLVKNIDLRSIAQLLIASVLGGSLMGALLFCLL